MSEEVLRREVLPMRVLLPKVSFFLFVMGWSWRTGERDEFIKP